MEKHSLSRETIRGDFRRAFDRKGIGRVSGNHRLRLRSFGQRHGAAAVTVRAFGLFYTRKIRRLSVRRRIGSPEGDGFGSGHIFVPFPGLRHRRDPIVRVPNDRVALRRVAQLRIRRRIRRIFAVVNRSPVGITNDVDRAHFVRNRFVVKEESVLPNFRLSVILTPSEIFWAGFCSLPRFFGQFESL